MADSADPACRCSASMLPPYVISPHMSPRPIVISAVSYFRRRRGMRPCDGYAPVDAPTLGPVRPSMLDFSIFPSTIDNSQQDGLLYR